MGEWLEDNERNDENWKGLYVNKLVNRNSEKYAFEFWLY